MSERVVLEGTDRMELSQWPRGRRRSEALPVNHVLKGGAGKKREIQEGGKRPPLCKQKRGKSTPPRKVEPY